MTREVMRRNRTLRGRVSLLATATIAGWLLLLAVGLNVAVSRRLDQQIDDTLKVRAQAVSTIVEISNGSLAGVGESATDSELDSGIWVFAGHRVVAAPHSTGRTGRAAAQLADSAGGYATRHDRRFFVLPLRDERQRVGSVVAALDTDPYEKTKALVALASTAVAALVLLGAYPVLRTAAKRALRPMNAMTDQAAEWSVHSPTQRFGPRQRYAELQSLAGSLDELLDRASALMRHERQLNAELSHELRTPLTRMTTQADIALAGDKNHIADAMRAVRTSCNEMNSIIGTLLAGARTDLTNTIAHADLDKVFDSVAAGYGTNAAVSCRRTQLSVGVGPDIVERILGPVVDNAVRFASTTVRLDAVRVDTAVVVTVANDGETIRSEDAERIFEPGFRVVKANDSHDGAGLGLALAQRLTRAADGSIGVVSRSGWTTFEIQLPAG